MSCSRSWPITRRRGRHWRGPRRSSTTLTARSRSEVVAGSGGRNDGGGAAAPPSFFFGTPMALLPALLTLILARNAPPAEVGSTVWVRAGDRATGTGWVVDADRRWIVTARHV